MKTAMRRKYSNLWQWPDERFEGLMKIANAINTSFDIATGTTEVIADSELIPEYSPVLTPLRLAQRLRTAANQIEEQTEAAV